MSGHGRTMLVTGATGTVGRQLMIDAGNQGWDAVGCSTRGADDVVAWRIGGEPLPPRLRRHWDVVVHAAARPRWNLPAAQATAANVEPLAALPQVVGATTHLIHISTAYAIGLRRTTASADPADYRNTYEWSKAHAEREVVTRFENVTIVRPPLIVGRRSDGMAARFSGYYSVLKSTVSGTLPAFVGEVDSPQDIVSSCDVAACVLAVAERGPGEGDRMEILGRGARALSLKEATDAMYLGLNRWRVARGLRGLAVPEVVTTDTWYRFYLPFARPHLTRRQLRTIDLFSEFIPYLSLTEPLTVTWPVAPMGDCLETAAAAWADRLPRFASGTPRPWTGAE